MERKKINLKRIECPKERSSKFSKRKKGILKKAQELAVLCDIDIAMILVSPTDKPTLFHSHFRSLSYILDKFCKTPLQEREKRRAYTIKTLKKVVNNNNLEISIENDHLLPARDEVMQDENKVTKLREVMELIAEKTLILSNWENPSEVNNMNELNIMENYIVSSLNHIRNTIKIKTQEEEQPLI